MVKKDKKDKYINVRLSQENFEELAYAAFIMGDSKSEAVRNAIDLYCKMAKYKEFEE